MNTPDYGNQKKKRRKKRAVPVLSPDAAAKAAENIRVSEDPDDPDAVMPSGYRRKDQLAQRRDELAEAAQEYADDERTPVAFDPSKLRPDREILQKMQGSTSILHVSNPHADYVYCWVNRRNNNGANIIKRKALFWEVVQGDMQEARERAESYDILNGRAAGYRCVGDVILMRLHRAQHAQQQRLNRLQREARRGVKSSIEQLQALAQAHGSDVTVIEGEEADAVFSGDTIKQHAASQLAKKSFEQGLRDGTLHKGIKMRK